MVVTDFPAASDMSTPHDRTASPSRWTVQAPHIATPQPNFVPVNPRPSRRYHISGIDGSPSNVRSCPFTRKLTMMSSLAEPFVQAFRRSQPKYVNAAHPRRVGDRWASSLFLWFRDAGGARSRLGFFAAWENYNRKSARRTRNNARGAQGIVIRCSRASVRSTDADTRSYGSRSARRGNPTGWCCDYLLIRALVPRASASLAFSASRADQT